jgi:predicted O-methyltransferase YrrM
VTVEREPERARLARERLAGLDNVELLEGDWREELRDRGPFGLFFFDAGPEYDFETALALLAPLGLLVKDDLTPGRPVDGDPVRELLLHDHRLAAAEVLTTQTSAAIVAVKR